MAATRIWFEPAMVTSITEAGVGADEEPGYLEKLVAMAQAIDATSLNLEAIASVIREIAALTDAAFEQSWTESGDFSTERLRVANTLAAKVAEPASRLEVVVGDYRQSIQRMDPGVRYALTHMTRMSDATNALSFKAKVAETMLAVDENLPAIERYRRALLQTGEAARSLRRVFGRIVASLEQLLATRRIFDEWRALLQEQAR